MAPCECLLFRNAAAFNGAKGRLGGSVETRLPSISEFPVGAWIRSDAGARHGRHMAALVLAPGTPPGSEIVFQIGLHLQLRRSLRRRGRSGRQLATRKSWRARGRLALDVFLHGSVETSRAITRVSPAPAVPYIKDRPRCLSDRWLQSAADMDKTPSKTCPSRPHGQGGKEGEIHGAPTVAA